MQRNDFGGGNVMCNIAGYIGNRPAAPILIEMIRRQEGWNGGCYTGIATMHEGRVYYAKLTGDVDRLVENTDAAGLPGNIGIIHSRTPSGGGDEWAHPFVNEQHGNVMMAYVANGGLGCFANRIQEIEEKTRELEAAGYVFHSRSDEVIGRYPKLRNGGSVHMSDVMAQLIADKINRGMDASEAMDRAFCEMPSEIVGLMISLNEPDAVVWSRINMPMFIGLAPHGAYLASTSQAFPKDAGEAALLPANAGGKVYKTGYTIAAYTNPPASVAPITPWAVAEAYNAIVSALGKEPCTFNMLTTPVKSLFTGADCSQTNALVYWILSGLQKEGRLKVSRNVKPGVAEGITAPVFRGKLR